MTPTLSAHAGKEDVERYQELLDSDWSKDTLDDVLSLLWKLIAASANAATFPWQRVLAFHTTRVASKHFDKQVLDRIRELVDVFTEPGLPPMPRDWSQSRAARSLAQVEMSWAYLVLQALAGLTGDTGIFRDTQSLLFLHGIHYLLPHLKQQGLLAEHDCLVNAMYVHTLLAWREQPEHLFYLQSLLMEHLGHLERRAELLETSFRLTPPEDHSYLTKASAYWADLLDLGQRKRALSFLLSLNKVAPPSCAEEIEEMLAETVAEGRPRHE
jgi:hypothetical protein